MLQYWLSQTKFADANVEARLEREPFILNLKGAEMAKSKPCTYAATPPALPKGARPKGNPAPKMTSNGVRIKGAKK